MSVPRVLVAGVAGGSGKTLLAVGLAAAWRKQGRAVAPYKKGPDYIDAAWLSRAAEAPCRNLDLYLMRPETIVRSFARSAGGADVAVVEGNRGVFDGLDARGTCSTAELAKLLHAPVILTVDCAKATRTVAAVVLGCLRLDTQVPIRGVVLNRTGGSRHELVLREAIESSCGVPVLGAVPRIPDLLLTERHLGLVPPEEHARVEQAIQQAVGVVEEHLDLEVLWDLARQAPVLGTFGEAPSPAPSTQPATVRIGVCRDPAFQFYYPENLEALAREGGKLVEVSPLGDRKLPEVDALYIGGGFPETLAAALAGNGSFRDSVRKRVEAGLPVYAECGGAVYLGERLQVDERQYPMVGALPVDFTLHAKPQGHGYAALDVVGENPFYTVGESIRGHEFHYTCIEPPSANDMTFAFRVRRGYGFDGRHDGLCRRNVLASYTHVHAHGTETWAPSLIRTAVRFRNRLRMGAVR